MGRKELCILWMCVCLVACELLGPESRKESEKSEDEDDIVESLDTNAQGDSDYMKQLTEAVNKEILTLQEYAEAFKKTKIEPKDEDNNKDSQLEQMEYTLKLLKKSLLRHTEPTWIHDPKDGDSTASELEKLGEHPQDILNTLPPLPEEEEVELTPELKEAKELYDAATAKLRRRSPDIRSAIMQVKQSADRGYIPAKIKLAWSHVFGEGVDMDIEAAKAIFEELAEQGNGEAHAGMGFLYATGTGVPVSQAKALVHYTLGALGDSDFAQMALAYRHWSGVTVPSSCPKAMDLYMKVAAKVASQVSASGGPGVQRARLLDEEAAGGALDTDLIEYYQLLAEKGDVQAQVGLGQLHFQGGRGVTLDMNKALHYFQQAAKTGNAVANAFLGKIYLEGGDGIKPDNETALRYFKKAAELNNPVGQSGLGIMYLQGRGVPKDTTSAFKYFTMAANQGWVEGQLHLGFMYFGGVGVRRDFKQANKYFSLASQSGHVLALYHLAHMHAQGLGVLRSCTTAVELFKNVCERGPWSSRLMLAHAAWRARSTSSSLLQYLALAERGLEVAQSNAAFILDEGVVGPYPPEQRYPRALQLWSRAASQGCAAARVKLGDYHYYGLGTHQDLDAAAHHYRIASEQLHNAQATFNLGYMHERGLGLARDVHLAKRCYDLAADTAPEARLPAALALARLNALVALDQLYEVSVPPRAACRVPRAACYVCCYMLRPGRRHGARGTPARRARARPPQRARRARPALRGECAAACRVPRAACCVLRVLLHATTWPPTRRPRHACPPRSRSPASTRSSRSTSSTR
ncbi:protein sel-1 homolog 1 isoform X2 [Galleria mellonella]|uniref:Protein sel-1 homolog 1 isoform X2 n=1 Tax=Galleria mellonella TaxID=7137 RepID=A0ABM3MYE4_GALME|nr:protein sel-1 homolog 1 isoform X2 [Galleria mellonella]